MNRLIRNVACWIDGSLRWVMLKPSQTLFKVLTPSKPPSNGLLLGHFSAQSAEKMETEIQWMITNSNAWSSSWVSNFSSKLAGKKKALLKTHGWLCHWLQSFVSKHTVNTFESPGVIKAWDSMKTKVRWPCSFSMWKKLGKHLFFLLTWTSTWGFMNFNMRFHEVSTSSSVCYQSPLGIGSIKIMPLTSHPWKKLLMSFPLKEAFRYQKNWDVHGHGILLLYSTSHLFRYKMDKFWKILQFGDISTGDHSAVGAALLLMRLPSLLIKPIASCRSLTRFVKIITFALDSCIFGGSFRQSMYRYPCFGIHG